MSENTELPADDGTPAVAAGSDEPGEPMRWYVLKVQSNREKSIRENILRRARREGLEHFFGEIRIPTEKIWETKDGKKKVIEQKLYPGYLMIFMVLNEESWFLVRETGGVGDFTGSAGKPSPMQDHEIARMLGQVKDEVVEVKKVKITIAPGATVKIKDGPFTDFQGSVESVDEANARITVVLEIFGRSVPAEFEHWQIEQV